MPSRAAIARAAHRHRGLRRHRRARAAAPGGAGAVVAAVPGLVRRLHRRGYLAYCGARLLRERRPPAAGSCGSRPKRRRGRVPHRVRRPHRGHAAAAVAHRGLQPRDLGQRPHGAHGPAAPGAAARVAGGCGTAAAWWSGRLPASRRTPWWSCSSRAPRRSGPSCARSTRPPVRSNSIARRSASPWRRPSASRASRGAWSWRRPGGSWP